jgi:hypothetical protein
VWSIGAPNSPRDRRFFSELWSAASRLLASSSPATASVVSSVARTLQEPTPNALAMDDLGIPLRGLFSQATILEQSLDNDSAACEWSLLTGANKA